MVKTKQSSQHQTRSDGKKPNIILSDMSKLIMILFRKEGPLDAQQIESRLIRSPFAYSAKKQRFRKDKQEMVNLVKNCNDLVQNGIIQLGEDGKFTLTENGQQRCSELSTFVSAKVNPIERFLLTPQAGYRVSILMNGLFAGLKLVGGFLSGSIGLIADGADGSIDTTSATVAWVGSKVKREIIGVIVTVGLMFFSAISLIYGIRSVVDGILIGFNPVTFPTLIIGIESGALLASIFLRNHLGFLGKRSGNLTLISQSVDAKNHSFIAIVIITSTILSFFGVYFFDSLIGIFIALRLILDATALTREAIRSASGEALNLSKYGTFFEKRWNKKWIQSYKLWILYSITEYKLNTKAELIDMLEKTFSHGFVPILSDTELNDGIKYDFNAHFDELIQSLKERSYVSESKGIYNITEKGKSFLEHQCRVLRFYY